MGRHRLSAPPPPTSSSDEEDAFAALSKKSKKNKKNKRKRSKSVSEEPSKTEEKDTNNADKKSSNGSGVNTSSNKRHHNVSTERAAKMDALLQELQAAGAAAATATPADSSDAGHYGPGSNGGFVPHKKGSFVEAGEEHLTTNIFVGNLDPSVTEEQLTELFRAFGDLYSVKIMWPRTDEERARNRNTGFVCFMAREDAQDAMDAYQDCDAFRNGRRMLLRWGKNVKKTVKRGTGGVPIAPIKKRRKAVENEVGKQGVVLDDGDKGSGGPLGKGALLSPETDSKVFAASTGENQSPANAPLGTSNSSFVQASTESSLPKTSNTVHKKPPHISPLDALRLSEKFDPAKDTANAIRVVKPITARRVRFITAVASFVSKDGSVLERKLIEKESSNPDFFFLNPAAAASSSSLTNPLEVAASSSVKVKKAWEEFVFYRWRVYAFCQGDGINAWRTEPFRMFAAATASAATAATGAGQWWIPPPLDTEAARREEEMREQKELDIIAKQQVRRKLAEKKDFMTGRQLEHAKSGSVLPEVGVQLSDKEKDEFQSLLTSLKTSSKRKICEIMAFCFDKSGAAKQISQLLKEAAMMETEQPLGALKEDDGGEKVDAADPDVTNSPEGKPVSLETRVARLYLLSDVLFNSQQPGVRNAFRYRDSIEAMAPDVFRSLGRQGRRAGRMTLSKLGRSVNKVLEAWNSWSVFDTGYIEGLRHAFEEWKEAAKEKDSSVALSCKNDMKEVDVSSENVVGAASCDDKPPSSKDNQENSHADSVAAPVGDWIVSEVTGSNEGLDATHLENIDGEPLDEEDTTVEPAGGMRSPHQAPLEDEDLDGEPIDDDDVDGEPLDDSEL